MIKRSLWLKRIQKAWTQRSVVWLSGVRRVGKTTLVRMLRDAMYMSELLDLDEELQDYVIVHELLHFGVPNHGKLWKSLMTAHLGDYQKLEKRLAAQRR